jgi:hypothetical protein
MGGDSTGLCLIAATPSAQRRYARFVRVALWYRTAFLATSAALSSISDLTGGLNWPGAEVYERCFAPSCDH